MNFHLHFPFCGLAFSKMVLALRKSPQGHYTKERFVLSWIHPLHPAWLTRVCYRPEVDGAARANRGEVAHPEVLRETDGNRKQVRARVGEIRGADPLLALKTRTHP